jgi:predicted MFS family arabinose efflux permease
LISVAAVYTSDFWLFCLGTALVGVFQAFAQYYRLAAADAVPAEAKSRAISVVLTGGVIAAIAGPALAAWAKDLFPAATFAGAYLMVALLGVASALLLIAYRDQDGAPAAEAQASGLPARPLGIVMRQPIFVAALANNVVGSVSMMFVMTAAPLAAVACQHSIADGASIMQWHLVGMYAPAFFAGALINRLGLPRVLGMGMALNAACSLIAMQSTSLAAFHAALFCLGVGWNFMFVGGTTLLAQSYRPAERARVQGAAEMLRYATTALATLAAGPALQRMGWETLNAAMLPIVGLAAVMTGWWALSRRAGQVAA